MLCPQKITRFQLNEKVEELFQEVESVGLLADYQHE